MKALFITTATNDVDGVLSAWDYYNPPSARVKFDHMHPVKDSHIIHDAKRIAPEVIFYIGSVGPYGPAHSTLRSLREIAPFVHICFDGGDEPWWPLLIEFSKECCFDLQVTIDGVKNAPVDLVTVAPCNPLYFDGPAPDRDIRCGFSGNIGMAADRTGTDPRGFIIAPLVAEGLVTLRERVVTGGLASYPEHVEFMRRCRIVINTSFAGSGLSHHVKMRVFETAFAGCALLEDDASPIGGWLPTDCYFPYRDSEHAGLLIRTLGDEVIDESARVREAYVRERYSPQNIYGEMLSRVNL